jgi:hypothetical protein
MVDEHKRRRRRLTLWRITVGLGAVVFGACRRAEPGQAPDSFDVTDKTKRAEEMERLQVERLYSTKPVRVRMGKQEYVIPVNHFTEKGRDNPTVVERDGGFGFVLFLPDYGGFTKENWLKGWFDPRRIEVLELKPVDKNARAVMSDGTIALVGPAGYGDPKAQFENIRSLLEAQPSLKAFGLAGYRRRNGAPGVFWTGTRSTGEFFFFDSSFAPGEPQPRAAVHPLCNVGYYSEHEDLFIRYIYSQEHIAAWREIDDAIWKKLRSWRAV